MLCIDNYQYTAPIYNIFLYFVKTLYTAEQLTIQSNHQIRKAKLVFQPLPQLGKTILLNLTPKTTRAEHAILQF